MELDPKYCRCNHQTLAGLHGASKLFMQRLERPSMPHVKLTAKQEAFCQGIADGLGQADSYRAAYDAEGMKDNTIYPLASKLMKNEQGCRKNIRAS
jgi:hypothetical protein